MQDENLYEDGPRIPSRRDAIVFGWMIAESPSHFSTIRKNIFFWVEECYRLIAAIENVESHVLQSLLATEGF
jgi:hypothetical protein